MSFSFSFSPIPSRAGSREPLALLPVSALTSSGDRIISYSIRQVFFFEPKIPLMPTQVASFNERKQGHWMRTFPKPTRKADKHAKRLQEGGNTQHNQSVEGFHTVCSDEATRHNQVDESHSESHPPAAQDLINPFLVRFLFILGAVFFSFRLLFIFVISKPNWVRQH